MYVLVHNIPQTPLPYSRVQEVLNDWITEGLHMNDYIDLLRARMTDQRAANASFSLQPIRVIANQKVNATLAT